MPVPGRTGYMQLTRRSVGAASLVGLTSLAGCTALTGGSLSFESDPAGVSSSTRSETGYEQADQRSTSLERTFAGQDVTVTNWITQYQKSVELGGAIEAKLGVFVAFTTPAVKIAGQGPFNPVGNVSTSELVKRLQGQYASMQDVEKVGSSSVGILGSSTNVDKFSATTTFEGQEIDLYLHIAKRQHEKDFVIPVGIYPQRLDGEESNVTAMMKALRHPVEVQSETES